MRARLGLQGRMAVSYVVATVAIVVFVEAIAGALVLPRLTTGQDATVRALQLTQNVADKLARASGLKATSSVVSQAIAPPDGGVLVVLDPSGRVVSSSAPTAYRVGADATRLLPAGAVVQLHGGGKNATNPKLGAAAVAVTPDGKRVWALAPIRAVVESGEAATDLEVNPKLGTVTGTVGYAYVEEAATTGYVLSHRLSSGALVLLLTVPVGVAFGLATTRTMRRRLRRLAEASQAVAAGDFATRVSPSSADEVGRLERNFNEMAARLGEAGRREVELASQNARLAERSRISRELHDSISQELFSLGLLAGGLQRALPEDSPLQPQVARLSETVAAATREMRALVLDLHPSALADKGLDAALEELCATYQARAGVGVTASIEPVGLDAPSQHAVLRITQEALANATKHADPRRISVRLGATASGVELVVSDDGRGFDPASPSRSAGIGLRLMRERVAELGGTLEVESTPDRGTAVRVHLPVPPPIAATPVGVGPPATHPAR